MSYNGTGTFLINTAGQPVVTNTVISATTFNLLTADLANGLTNAITKDGQTTVTANIPMSNFKITGLGAATTANDAVRLEQLTSGATNVSFGNLTYTGTLTGGTGVINIGSGQIYKDASGNVGIGTSSPSGKFNVAGGRAFFGGNNEQYSIGVGYNQSRVSSGVHVYYIGATDSTTPALVFSESGGAEKMRLTHDGNVGIGTASPAQKLSIGTNGVFRMQTGSVTMDCTPTPGGIDGFVWNIVSGGYYDWSLNGGSKMRIDSSGNLLVGTTSATTVNTGVVSIPNPGEIIIGHPDGTVSTWGYMGFKYNNSLIGSITQSGTTAVLYNTTSDHRLKTNIVPLSNALNKIMALKPSEFEWVDGRNDDGFIAHELQAVLPNVVTGDKDAVDEDGNPKYQQVDYSRVVATLTAAIQEQQALIQDLTTRLTALEGN